MCRGIYFLAVLFSSSRASDEPLTLRPGENLTLPCNVPPSTHMAWYLLRNNNLTMLLSAKEGLLDTENLAVDYNPEPSHFQALGVNHSLSLIIVDVRESDSGLYYCGRRLSGQHLQFGKAVHLKPPGAEGGVSLCWKLLIAAAVFALALGLCVSMLVYKLGLQTSFCKNCVVESSSLKVVDLHYASLRHTGNTPQTGPAPPDHSVIYGRVARKTPANPRA